MSYIYNLTLFNFFCLFFPIFFLVVCIVESHLSRLHKLYIDYFFLPTGHVAQPPACSDQSGQGAPSYDLIVIAQRLEAKSLEIDDAINKLSPDSMFTEAHYLLVQLSLSVRSAYESITDYIWLNSESVEL